MALNGMLKWHLKEYLIIALGTTMEGGNLGTSRITTAMLLNSEYSYTSLLRNMMCLPRLMAMEQ